MLSVSFLPPTETNSPRPQPPLRPRCSRGGCQEGATLLKLRPRPVSPEPRAPSEGPGGQSACGRMLSLWPLPTGSSSDTGLPSPEVAPAAPATLTRCVTGLQRSRPPAPPLSSVLHPAPCPPCSPPSGTWPRRSRGLRDLRGERLVGRCGATPLQRASSVRAPACAPEFTRTPKPPDTRGRPAAWGSSSSRPLARPRSLNMGGAGKQMAVGNTGESLPRPCPNRRKEKRPLCALPRAASASTKPSRCWPYGLLQASLTRTA